MALGFGTGLIQGMDRDVIIAGSKEAEADLKARGVVHAALSGSVARGERHPISDLDVMVDPDRHGRMDVFNHGGIVHLIEDPFPRRGDVSNCIAMKDHVRPGAERDAFYAFKNEPGRPRHPRLLQARSPRRG